MTKICGSSPCSSSTRRTRSCHSWPKWRASSTLASPARQACIKGAICGHRVEEIDDPLMQKVRYLDKLIDELAKGKKMDAIVRTPVG